MSRNRSGLTREQMWAELSDLDQRCVKIAGALSPTFRDAA
jgi:hypothetical protein